MTKQDRKELELRILEVEKARDILSAQKESIEQLRDEQQEKFDNLSEGLQQSEMGSRLEDAVNKLDEALQSAETAEDNANYMIEYMQAAIDC